MRQTPWGPARGSDASDGAVARQSLRPGVAVPCSYAERSGWLAATKGDSKLCEHNMRSMEKTNLLHQSGVVPRHCVKLLRQLLLVLKHPVVGAVARCFLTFMCFSLYRICASLSFLLFLSSASARFSCSFLKKVSSSGV